jgi:hypothetical protein
LLAGLMLAAVGVITLHPRETEAVYVAPSMEYGASVFVIGRPETINRDLDMVKAAGMQWVRIDILWDMIEHGCNDCYDFTELDPIIDAINARGLKIIARVDHPPAWARQIPAVNGPPDNIEDYADIIAALTARYTSARLPVLLIWNEPNLSREWGNDIINESAADLYMLMLRRAYEEAKEKDPNITILSAGLSPTGTADGTAQPDDVYLQWMYDNGLVYFSDGIGIHANAFGLPPEAALMSDPSRPHPSFYFRRAEQLRDIMVLNGDAAKQAWIMEFGYTSDTVNPSYSWHAVDENTKADYIVRALKYAKANWSPWLAEMTVWSIADPLWNPNMEQYYWAITNPDGTPRPAYTAIQQARTSGALP